MVNKKLVSWIKGQRSRGYSDADLKQALTKQGYSTDEVLEAFDSLNDNKKSRSKVAFSVSFLIFLGLVLLSSILTTIILTLSSFSAGFGYILLILFGLGMGYYIYHIKKVMNASEKFGVLLGIFSPILSLFSITTFLKVAETLTAALSTLNSAAGSSAGISAGSMPSGILSMFSSTMNPFISAILFYLCFNVFLVISVVKKKEDKVLFWYLLAFLIFILIWFFVDFLISSMTSTII